MKNKLILTVLILIFNFSLVHASPCNNTDATDTPVPCAITDSYRYFTVGVGPFVVIPNIGLGYRERSNQFGWDTGLSFSTIGVAHQFSGQLIGHYYLQPQEQSSNYIGAGVLGGCLITNRGRMGGTVSPDFVFGKELERKGACRHFIEMHVAMPSLWIHKNRTEGTYIPLVYIKYGTSF